MVAHEVHALERLGSLGDQLDPMFRMRQAGVDRNELAPRGVLVGLEPEDRAIVVDELVFSLELAHEMNGILRRLVERPVEDRGTSRRFLSPA